MLTWPLQRNKLSIDTISSHADSIGQTHYLPFKFFLLVFKGLLHFVHKTTLLEQTCGRTHTIELEGWRKFDLLVFNHLEHLFVDD